MKYFFIRTDSPILRRQEGVKIPQVGVGELMRLAHEATVVSNCTTAVSG